MNNVASERPGTSVGVQVVLYENDPGLVERLARSIAATLRRAITEREVASAIVRFGDCSRYPCLGDDDRDAIGRALDGVAQVSFTHFGANLGSGGGSNALAGAGDEDTIWVLNPDTYPAPTALGTLVRTLDQPAVGAAEARQVPIEHPKHYDPRTGETSWGCGYSLLLSRAAFDAVGGFDDHFFPLYCDDVDLSWRLRLAGWQIHYAPAAVVFHDKPISSGGAVRWTPHAARSSHLARLFLYRRYGRPDLEAELLERARRGDDALLLDAAREFEARRDAGDVPGEEDGAARVAEFVDGNFGPWRFHYAR